MHDGIPHDPIKGQGRVTESHSRGVDRQSRTGLILVQVCIILNLCVAYMCMV